MALRKYADKIEFYTDNYGNERVRISAQWLADNVHKATRSHVHADILDKAKSLGYVSPKMYKLISQ